MQEIPADKTSHNWIEDGVLYGKFAPNLVIDLETAKESVKERLRVSNGTSYPILVDIQEIKFVNKEARDYLSTGVAIENVKAAAFLIGSNVSKIISNIFLTFNKPPIPTKIFTNRTE